MLSLNLDVAQLYQMTERNLDAIPEPGSHLVSLPPLEHHHRHHLGLAPLLPITSAASITAAISVVVLGHLTASPYPPTRCSFNLLIPDFTLPAQRLHSTKTLLPIFG